MALNKKYFIHSARNGELGDTTPGDIDAIIEGIRGTEKVVLHFHGGLVNRSSAMKTAERLQPEYEKFAHPVFFIWESGLTETWGNNGDELVRGLLKIAGEEIFKKLSSTVSKWTVGKLSTEAGLKAGPGMLNLPADDEHAQEMHKATTGEVPYENFESVPLQEVEDVDDHDEQGIREELESDNEFVADVEAILAAQEFDDADEFRSARPNVRPTTTLMSPEIVDALVAEEGDPGEKGFFSAAFLAKRAARVLFRVVRRFRVGRDHGIYTTVFEELVRELYLAAVGGETWQIMKKETADTFLSTPSRPRAGELFLRKLAELGDDRPNRIVLVGHSAGAVFVNNLLDATREAREGGRLPADFKFDGVVFLAPACTFSKFASILPKDGEAPLFGQFRMFTMDDVHERTNRLVSVVYPRSLLYFVSGVVERELDGAGAFDMPLVGMDRYYWRDEAARDAYAELGPEIKSVRDFVHAGKRAVWSPSSTDSPAGFRADAISHSGFDDTGIDEVGKAVPRAAIDSVRHILEKGWA